MILGIFSSNSSLSKSYGNTGDKKMPSAYIRSCFSAQDFMESASGTASISSLCPYWDNLSWTPWRSGCVIIGPEFIIKIKRNGFVRKTGIRSTARLLS